MESLEKRMYFLVPYNISPIQQAIQAGHAALEYARKYKDDSEYVDFVDNYKTWIILNGGTTNKSIDRDSGLPYGTLNKSLYELEDFNFENPDLEIHFECFYEPDLNDALTAICLIVDERVFNREDYPDFREWLDEKGISKTYQDQHLDTFIKTYESEVGKDIVFLKELLNTKKLA